MLCCGFAETCAPADIDERAQGVVKAERRTRHLNIDVSIIDDSTLADGGKLIVDMVECC